MGWGWGCWVVVGCVSLSISSGTRREGRNFCGSRMLMVLVVRAAGRGVLGGGGGGGILGGVGMEGFLGGGGTRGRRGEFLIEILWSGEKGSLGEWSQEPRRSPERFFAVFPPWGINKKYGTTK